MLFTGFYLAFTSGSGNSVISGRGADFQSGSDNVVIGNFGNLKYGNQNTYIGGVGNNPTTESNTLRIAAGTTTILTKSGSNALQIDGDTQITGSLGINFNNSTYYGTQISNNNTAGDIFSYATEYNNFYFGVFSGSYDNELYIAANQNDGIKYSDWNGSGYSEWLVNPPNTGTNPAPQFKRGLGITGSLYPHNGLDILGSVDISGSLTTNNDIFFSGSNYQTQGVIGIVNNQTLQIKNNGLGGGYNQSGSAIQMSFNTGSGGNASFQMNANVSGSSSDFSILNVAGITKVRGLAEEFLFSKTEGFPSTAADKFEVIATDITLNGNTVITGSLNVSSKTSIANAMNLTTMNPLPTGVVGDLAVSGSSLFFYNGAWTLII
jgi:hypothetical protein